jgi:Amt family ammonium transporter
MSDPDATFGGQLEGLLVIFGWVFVTSAITWKIIDLAMGIRVSDEEESAGVDIAECGMEAYPEFTSAKS